MNEKTNPKNNLKVEDVITLETTQEVDTIAAPVDNREKVSDIWVACYYLHHRCMLENIEVVYDKGGYTDYVMTIYGSNIKQLKQQLIAGKEVINIDKFRESHSMLESRMRNVLAISRNKRRLS